MRTFIALEPPPELRTAVGELNAALKSRLANMKWVKPNLVHLTLRFLGEIEPGRIGALNQAVADAAGEIGSFELNVTEIGHFGSALNPRVLWLGLAASSNLSSLAAGLEASLESAGFGRADKPFRAHLTLARAGRRPGPAMDWDAVAGATPPRWPHWSVGAISVIKSTLTPSGPLYKTLSIHELTG
jgi:RNA 2',3'-cyclic 3'-phosphodiesterase